VEDIYAGVLTYNRKELVLRCLRSLLDQTHPLKGIIVLDNASTDGTYEAIQALNEPRIEVVRLEHNIGAARGFNAMMKYVYEVRKVKWGYLMDDDVECSPTAVAELAAAYDRNFTAPEQVGFFLSQNFDAAGNLNNVPAIDTRPKRLGECADWGRYLDQGIASIRGCALTCVLVPHTTYEAFGDLILDFVVWGEDLEYTFRITQHRPGLLVGTSKITHLRAQMGDISIFLEDNPKRVPNFYYLYRNQMFVRRRYMSAHAYVLGFFRGMWETTKLLRQGELWKAQFPLRGTLAGLTYNPKVPEPRFNIRTASTHPVQELTAHQPTPAFKEPTDEPIAAE